MMEAAAGAGAGGAVAGAAAGAVAGAVAGAAAAAAACAMLGKRASARAVIRASLLILSRVGSSSRAALATPPRACCYACTLVSDGYIDIYMLYVCM